MRCKDEIKERKARYKQIKKAFKARDKVSSQVAVIVKVKDIVQYFEHIHKDGLFLSTKKMICRVILNKHGVMYANGSNYYPEIKYKK